ncbi:MAG: hypothetical protein J0L82_08430 [Deltaproteobacteria bacterium]|nr:hypothetical protein [Deltaproteobacteria bacterium]
MSGIDGELFKSDGHVSLGSIFDLRTHVKELLCVGQDLAATNVQMTIGVRFADVTAAMKFMKLKASECWHARSAERVLPPFILLIRHRDLYCDVHYRRVSSKVFGAIARW